jgi:hypothetical protein
MDFHDKIPIKFGHFHETSVSKNTCIVNDNIDSSKCIYCSLNNFITMLNRVVVCYCLPTCFLDFINNNICRSLCVFRISSSNRATKIVYNYFSTTARKEMCVNTTKSVSSTSDDCNFTIKSKLAHCYFIF